MKTYRTYNGIRMLPERTAPFPENVWRIDAGAMPMIARMQKRGLQVDLSHFERMDKTLTADMERATSEIHDLTGYWINPGSGDQVADLLFKRMGLKQAKRKMTSSGDRESVEDAVLTAIQHEHPVVGKCLEYKEYEKLRGTYVRPMPKLAKRMGFGVWRMYPNFRTTRVPSGRLSCADPNLLAMPSRTARGRQIREGFITDSGWVIVSIDESQIEMRLAAHRSLDVNLCNVYRNKEDIYSDFATSGFNLADKRYRGEDGKWKYPTVDKESHRRPAKTCVLASIYRVTAGGLQEQMPVICRNCNKPGTCLKCEQDKPHVVPDECVKHDCGYFTPYWVENNCQDMLNRLFMRYPGLVKMMIDDDTYMQKNAYIVDMWGRLWHRTAVRSVLEWVVATCKREGGNFPMQSGAQGTVKITMAAVDDDLEKLRMYDDVVYPLLQVHDELLFECQEDVAEDVGQLVKRRFETLFHLAIPIEAGVAIAPTWGSLEK